MPPFSSLKQFPRAELGHWPTPLIELRRLSDRLGVQLFIKRDDLSGLALGGNKTRKLEYILGDALEKGCDTLITAGAAQSNHCRQTAAAAAQFGLKCHLMLGGRKPEHHQGNLLLNDLLGAKIHWSEEDRKGEGLQRLHNQLSDSGSKPYLVPYGGSNELGVIGYVSAVAELASQNRDDVVFDYSIFASSSGGTHAGLMLGNRLSKQWKNLIGVNIDKQEFDGGLAQHIVNLANATALNIDVSESFNQSDCLLDDGYLGEGYGVVGQPEIDAIELLARNEGILLDPVYSGRAFAGMLGLINSGKIKQGSSVLFWHTGGAPALFAYAETLTLG